MSSFLVHTKHVLRVLIQSRATSMEQNTCMCYSMSPIPNKKKDDYLLKPLPSFCQVSLSLIPTPYLLAITNSQLHTVSTREVSY